MMNKDTKIFIAGHEGMIGAALIKCLKTAGFNDLITKSFSQLELTDQSEVHKFFLQEKSKYVFIVPIKEGGILANTNYPADLFYINLQIQSNLIHFAWETKVKKLIFLCSSCIYPKFCPQPMKEEALWMEFGSAEEGDIEWWDPLPTTEGLIILTLVDNASAVEVVINLQVGSGQRGIGADHLEHRARR